MLNREITVFSSLEYLSRAAAKKFTEIARTKISHKDSFAVALAGGSTPKSLYKLLADENEPFRTSIEWEKVSFFWGDERCVAPDSDESNYRMAKETLLQPLGIPTENIYRWKSELDPATAAADYEKLLRLYFNAAEGIFPRFDLILLGMGADGHTASLFPQTDVFAKNSNLVAAPLVEKFGTHRLTLTPQVINSAENIIFQVAGQDKANALREVLEGEKQIENYPSQIIDPPDGNILWLLDEAAAQNLTINRSYENVSGSLKR